MSSATVKTKNATYAIDRDGNRWMRISATAPKADDGEWVEGGFTIGGIGERCFAHYESHPEDATGRWTSRVISVEEYDE